MAILQNKIDFAAIVSVTRANINGDPLNGNRPREDYNGYGIFSDVAIKRKIRNRLQEMGNYIFVQTDGMENDMKFDPSLKENYHSLKERAAGDSQLAAEIKKGKDADAEVFAKIACEKWIDVRSFGQVFAFKKDTKKAIGQEDENGSQLSVGVRGPVSIQQAVSVDPIEIVDMQITKSVNAEAGKSGKASDTMGTKHYVNFGLYVIRGSINCQLAEKTGFTDEDAEKIKISLCTLFENDASSARPDGTCEVCCVYWWKHDEKTPKETSATIQRSLQITTKVEEPRSFTDYEIPIPQTACIPEVINLV
ncbi:MAG: type I-C CRISPR-associated protein Cas7/Csd2 [Clostridiaceae bacterium]|nr:type I-C CRISPR-associated protein Cas7/Csd2 [Clostridiaceae bacterium]